MELLHRWYSGQGGALPPVVQWPGGGSFTGGTLVVRGSSTGGSGQGGALPPLVQWPGGGSFAGGTLVVRSSSTGGRVAREGLFHRWYSGHGEALSPVVHWL